MNIINHYAVFRVCRNTVCLTGAIPGQNGWHVILSMAFVILKRVSVILSAWLVVIPRSDSDEGSAFS